LAACFCLTEAFDVANRHFSDMWRRLTDLAML
jgi:hypothetical protein